MAFADAVYLTASATLFSFGQRRPLLPNYALLTDILYILKNFCCGGYL